MRRCSVCTSSDESLKGLRRQLILNALGPLLLPALVVTFIVCLIFGYALIYWPQMPSSLNVDEKAQAPSWIEAIYYSGITLPAASTA